MTEAEEHDEHVRVVLEHGALTQVLVERGLRAGFDERICERDRAEGG